jgi:hypothetical protein
MEEKKDLKLVGAFIVGLITAVVLCKVIYDML